MSEPYVEPSITIPKEAWAPTGPEGNEKCRLLTGLTINGCFMHLEAYQVKEHQHRTRTWSYQQSADPYFEDEVDAIYRIDEGAKATVRIGRRDYILVSYPHQE